MTPKRAGITVDTLDDFQQIAYTEEKIKWLLEMLVRTGFERVYWYDYQAYAGLFRECGVLTGMIESLKNVPNHTELAVKHAHELGLEIFVTFKPYEQGPPHTHTPGSEEDRKYGTIERIGGRNAWATDWLDEHAHLRVQRRMDDIPEDINERTIDRIEIDKNDNAPSGLRREDIKVYVSRDNATYEEYTGPWQLKEEVVPALLLDYFGLQLNTETHETSRMTLSGLGIAPEWKYMAVTAGDKADLFRFIPMTMCRVYDGQGRRMPVTFATAGADRQARPPVPGQPGNFIESGFEFDDLGRAMGGSSAYYGTGFPTLKLGIARGVNEHFCGAPCEGYDEVRRHWLDEVRRLLSYGADGMEIRIANHSNDTQDPFAYGFNEPILQRYREREGADAVAYDPVKIMRIRGEFFTQFLAEAAQEIRRGGKKVQAQVIAPYGNGGIRGIANRQFTGVWPDWEQWLRELVDGITFRDFLARNYNPDFDKVIKPFARSLGREVWVPAYFTMSGGHVHDTYLRAVEADDNVTGVMFYETWPNYEEKDGRFEFKPECADVIKRFMERNQCGASGS